MKSDREAGIWKPETEIGEGVETADEHGWTRMERMVGDGHGRGMNIGPRCVLQSAGLLQDDALPNLLTLYFKYPHLEIITN